MAVFLGLPHYPFVTIPHPLSNNSEEEAARQCIALLESPRRLQNAGASE